ncbi:MAG: tryptophan synthase subunit beta [Planctomycetaceae bacterium]|jgi:tryptophan synthase beta chain|nr:tryptophan synthase subunit beta [Planctomycetaceae bacterium]
MSPISTLTNLTIYPDSRGYFGNYGGIYVGETLMTPLIELKAAAKEAFQDEHFWTEYRELLRQYVGRETPCYFAKRLSEYLCNNVQNSEKLKSENPVDIDIATKIWLKREDLNHTGAHKINNTIGQALLARRMGKKRLIAETGAGQHGVATATVAALLGFECCVFMGREDIRRQQPNVQRMELLGAKVVSVESGTATLKDAMNETFRYWSEVVNDTFYVVGTVAGPDPYPWIVREFQKIIGEEARRQMFELTGKLPDCIIAAVGGGSNAMGIFYPFLNDKTVELIGVEAAGKGLATGEHAASINAGTIGVLHGAKSMVLQDQHGQIYEAYSISAGLDYPGVGPEHSFLHDIKRVRYETITDKETLEAFQMLCRFEGIIPALESSHALAQAFKETTKYHTILVCLSGRGDKDLQHVREVLQNNPS